MIGMLCPEGPVEITATTNYHCVDCDVFGEGTSCWNCGSVILVPNTHPGLLCPGRGGQIP